MTSRSGGVMLSPVTPESSGGLALLHLSLMSRRARFRMPRIAEWVGKTHKPHTHALGISGWYLCSGTKCTGVGAPRFQGARLGSWLSQGGLAGQLPLAQSWALLVGRLSWLNGSMKWVCRKTSPLCISTYVYPHDQLQPCAISCHFKEPLLASECVMTGCTN